MDKKLGDKLGIIVDGLFIFLLLLPLSFILVTLFAFTGYIDYVSSKFRKDK